MNRSKARKLFPRFLNAVTTMAVSSEPSRRRRLAWVVSDVLVFADSQIPEAIRDDYSLFRAIVSEPTLPTWAKSHPDYPKSVRAGHLSPARAKEATELLTSMFESIAYAAWTDKNDALKS